MGAIVYVLTTKSLMHCSEIGLSPLHLVECDTTINCEAVKLQTRSITYGLMMCVAIF